MKTTIKSVKGITEVLPDEVALFNHIEQQCISVFESASYAEIKLPVLEPTELFVRSVGEYSDIVQKELFTFQDRNGDSLTVRPEGTAGCAYAAIKNGMLNSPRRLWYRGPFFRRERPQKGRQRQFNQIGVEAYGMSSPAIEAEVIGLTQLLWDRLKIKDLVLKINCLGDIATRTDYAKALTEWLRPRADNLDDHSLHRLNTNPLRILDSKEPETIALLKDAPMISDYLDSQSKENFTELQYLLDLLEIEYKVDPMLVRGLDYYTGMVFEWIDPFGGAQSTVCAGGRYDRLIEELGGNQVSAVGFALGLERIALTFRESPINLKNPDIYFVTAGKKALNHAQKLAFDIRQNIPQASVEVDCTEGSFKAQLRRADKSNAKLAIIIGDDELSKGNITIKDLQIKSDQVILAQTELTAYIAGICDNSV